MAIRAYSCPTCGEFEQTQRISEPVLTACPACAGPVRSLISLGAPPVFVYRPMTDKSGWADTGYSKALHKRKAEKLTGRS